MGTPVLEKQYNWKNKRKNKERAENNTMFQKFWKIKTVYLDFYIQLKFLNTTEIKIYQTHINWYNESWGKPYYNKRLEKLLRVM